MTRYRWLGWLVAVATIGAVAVPLVSGQELHPTIHLNGAELKADVPAYVDLRAGRTLVPVRALAEPLGYEVAWQQEQQEVTLTRGAQEIRFRIGNRAAEVDGEAVSLDVAPRLVGSRSFVPLRFLAEVSGAVVEWDATALTVKITAATSAAEAPERGWGHQRGGLRRTGLNAASDVGARVEAAWRSDLQLGGQSMVLNQQMLFATGTDSKLYALDAATGARLWAATPAGAESVGAPTYDAGQKLVYLPVTDQQGDKLYAFDATTGRQAWMAVLPGQGGAESAVLVAVANMVVLGGEGSGYDAATGSLVSSWVGRQRYTNLTDAGLIFTADAKGVVAFDESTGMLAWERADTPVADGAHLASDGTYLWAPSGQGLAVLDADTGALVRRVNICHEKAASPVISKTHVFTACGGKVWSVDRSSYHATAVAEGAGPLALGTDRLYYQAADRIAALRVKE